VGGKTVLDELFCQNLNNGMATGSTLAEAMAYCTNRTITWKEATVFNELPCHYLDNGIAERKCNARS
jgi:hypothetical protein